MKRIPLLLATALAVIAVGCDSSMTGADSATRFDEVQAAFKSATATPIAAKSPGAKIEYQLELAFETNSGVRLPQAVNVLAQSAQSRNTSVWDNGVAPDAVAGDGIFTAIIPEGCIADDNTAGKGNDVGLSCKIEIVPPGQKCGKWGPCPETAERSFFWGLIEYETDIVFCFCLVDCDIEVKK